MFLGFDLSSGYNNSLLASGLESFGAADQLPATVRELWEATRHRYAPELNDRGLFQTFETALGCLKALQSLQDIHPNMFEGGDLRDFEVVQLFKVLAES